MSKISWSDQRAFREAYDKFRLASQPANPTREMPKKNNLVQGLNLKQMEKSIKYMTITEREAKAKQLKAKERADRRLTKADKLLTPPSIMNGEWENQHDFMCSSCAIVFDDLREILHHKWEAHPYCLVAHVTLRRDLNLPPSRLIHPQIGRSLTKHQSIKIMGARKTSPSKKVKNNNDLSKKFKCSKCTEMVFETKEEFYVHVLECGGDVDWDVSKKKKKKKKIVPKKNLSVEETGKIIIIFYDFFVRFCQF